MNAIKPPYLGVAYYPEDWDVSEIDKDIEKIDKKNLFAKYTEAFVMLMIFSVV